jgi:hypothetical protein
MKTLFKVERLDFRIIKELPNSWTSQNYIDLLEIMDYGNTTELAVDELKEMCMMSLTDNEPEDATKIVLEYIFNNRLTKGQIENLSNEMLNEKMWEEYADLSFHEDFFNAGQLLYETYNGKFPNPEALSFKIKVSTENSEDLSVFESQTEASLIRLLVKGMPQNTLINRLYDEQLEGETFNEAKDIIWQLKKEQLDNNSMIFSIISSLYWFKDLKYTEDFDATIISNSI